MATESASNFTSTYNYHEEDGQDDCKEEKGIEMSEDFDGKMQDIEKPEDEEDDSGESEDEDEKLEEERALSPNSTYLAESRAIHYL